MKFPVKNSKSNGNHSGVKKSVNGKVGLNKGVKNQRNLAQQERANKIPFGAKGKNNKRVNHEQERNEDNGNNHNQFEDEVGGMDANVNIKRRNEGKNSSRESKQYNELMQVSGKGFRRQKNKYFLQSDKYQGKRVAEQQQEEDDIEEMDIDEKEGNFDDVQESDDNEMIDEDDEDFGQDQQEQEAEQQEDEQEQNNEIHQALSQLQKKRQSTSKLIQSQLQSINLQDKKDINQIIKLKSKSTEHQYQQALGLKKLLEIFDKLVETRYGQQRQLQDIKKFPKMDQQNDTPKYPPMSHQLFTLNRQLENQIITNLSQSLQIYKNLAKNTISYNINKKDSDNQEEIEQETATDLEQLIAVERDTNQNQDDSLNPGRLNVDKIYEHVKNTLSKQTNLVEKQLIKWSQKTSFLSSTSSTHLSSLLMQTPVGQAKKVLSNWQRMANKCQQKRGQQLFRILFESQDNIHAMSDAQIYDDYDLFIELEKYYLEKVNDQNEDNQFLSSATMKYLKNKQANQLNHDRKQKDVDRKASKNRKIRFNVHTKLLNFMPAVQQNVLETRDEIVKNIFNCNARINEQAGEGNTYRGRNELREEELIDVE